MHPSFIKRFLPIVFSLAITMLCLFGSAGSFRWPNGWVLLGINLAGGVASTLLFVRDPELLAERANAKAGKGWDKPIVFTVVLLGPVATWITAGLDTRFRWSPDLGVLAAAAGVVAALLAVAFIAWAMRANRFFSAVIRIQKDRGHKVVTGGPYHYVRHPAYTGMCAVTLATPLILNSRWALVPAALTAAVTVLRTALEDRTLQKELEGYPAYARKVKYRLLPFVW
jgi:protein-S-isoprenylcysteine O-methyltransferase Ste14